MPTVLEDFAAEVRQPDAEVRLDRAALLIAAGEYPDLALDAAIARLDELAEGVMRLASPGAAARDVAAAIRQHLFAHLGFHGNAQEYYDPRNSYLNDVLTRRTGIPITLAAVWLEVARRLGLDGAGVSYPRHFLVKYRDGDEERVVDPFHEGAESALADLRDHLVREGATAERVAEYYLAAVTRRQMLTRMLTNLKLVYSHARDDRRALRVQEYLLALTPWSFEDMRDRGVLRARTGDVEGGIADLETYLHHNDAADDAASVRRFLQRLRGGTGTRDLT